MNAVPSKGVAGVIASYLLSVLLVFVISLMVQNEYFDFVVYGAIGSLGLVLFALWTLVLAIRINAYGGSKQRMIEAILPSILLLLLPLLAWLWLGTQSLKIGG